MGTFRKTVKRWVPPAIVDLLRPKPRPGTPDAHLYAPLFSPWLGQPFEEVCDKTAGVSLVSKDRLWVLHSLALQAMSLRGNVWETGVYRGGTATLFRDVIAQCGNGKSLRLFDTFEGMPETDSVRDLHQRGDFCDTSLQGVQAQVGVSPWIYYHQGYVPTTFIGLEAEPIALAHIDVDIYRSVLDSCEFIYPRLVDGGFIIFDDYGFPSCPGARMAVDEFFSTKPERPLVLSTGQALIFKSPARA